MGAGTERNSCYSPSGIKKHKHTKNDTQTLQYLVKFFYPADQVRVTGGVLKEYIIWGGKKRKKKKTLITPLCKITVMLNNHVGPGDSYCYFWKKSLKTDLMCAASFPQPMRQSPYCHDFC